MLQQKEEKERMAKLQENKMMEAQHSAIAQEVGAKGGKSVDKK